MIFVGKYFKMIFCVVFRYLRLLCSALFYFGGGGELLDVFVNLNHLNGDLWIYVAPHFSTLAVQISKVLNDSSSICICLYEYYYFFVLITILMNKLLL